jgi:hypothetical protein
VFVLLSAPPLTPALIFVPSSGSDTCLSLSAPLSSDDTAALRFAFFAEDFVFFFLLPFFPKFHYKK